MNEAPTGLNERELRELSDLALDQLELESRIKKGEELLAKLQDQHKRLSEVTIPEKMTSLGLSEIKLVDGHSVTIKPFFAAHISEERAPAAFSWLRDHGHEGIIKNIITVRFGAGDDALVKKAEKTLLAKQIPFERKESVHPSTLKSFVKEMVESAKPLPLETFGVYIGRKTVIK